MRRRYPWPFCFLDCAQIFGSARGARRRHGGEVLNTLAEIIGLSKRFGEFQAVADVSFSIAEGEFVGLLRPNGAGKTTKLHMVLGLITATAGTIRIFRMAFTSHRQEIRQQM